MSTATPPQRPIPSRPGSPPGRVGQAASAAGTKSITIDPVRVIRKYLFWLIASIFLGGMLGVGAFLLLDREYPLYSSEVIFEIRAGIQQSSDLGVQEIGRDELVARLANTEATILTSRSVLNEAVLHRDIQRNTEWGKQFIIRGEQGNEFFDVDSAVEDLRDSLRASAIRGTNFFRLQWQTHDASDLPIVLNEVARAYMDQRKASEERVWEENLDVFGRALEETTRELDMLDREIQDFIRDVGITTLADSRYSTVAMAAAERTRQITAVSSTLSLTQSSRLQVDAKLIGTIEPSAEDLREAKADPVVQGHNQILASLKTEQRRLQERFTADHPAVPNLERNLRAVEAERDAAVQEVVRQNLEARQKLLQNEIERTRDLLANLEEEMEAKDEQLRELTAHTARYHALELRRNRLEGQRETELMLIKELELIRLRADASRVRNVQSAITPRTKSFPKPFIVIPLVMLVMFGLTVALVFLRELTDQRIKSASDLTVIHGAKLVGVIPEIEEDPTRSKIAELVVRNHPNSVLAESYRQACALLTRSIERNGHQTLLLLGGLPSAGTTTAITNLGASLSATGRKVLVIDANFRRPELAHVMGVREDGPGLGDLLVGQSSVDEAVQESEAGVSVISAGTPANRVFERLNNGLFESIVAELRGRFDVILFDAPPAVVAGDAMVLANRVDAALLVVRANQEQRGLVARILNQLADARCEPLGILLNRPRGTAGGYFKKNFKAMARYANGS